MNPAIDHRIFHFLKGRSNILIMQKKATALNCTLLAKGLQTHHKYQSIKYNTNLPNELKYTAVSIYITIARI